MKREFTYTIGVMSGTSLDGIDLVYARFDKKDTAYFEIIEAETIPYTKRWESDLRNAIFYSKEKLDYLNLAYGGLLGAVIADFICKKKIIYIDFIASHGHTILHQPEKKKTLQIGDGQKIANITQKKVICDFRTQDVQLGGQGAPLVPIGDELLFFNYDYCMNLGGFANISYKKEEKRVAFDICPVNIVLNHYTRRLGLAYDDKGMIARSGKINKKLLQQLNSLTYYKKEAPKSLGLEWVQTNVFPMIDRLEENIPAILRTFVEHIGQQIGKIAHKNDTVLVTGGGVFNSFLIERIEFYSKERVVIPQKKLINYKEALIFAFLGLLRLDNQVNCLRSVTGAIKDHSSGVIFYPNRILS
ncbi:anhydro-N-acetylmuramic acid kinase [Tenacibaculum maritimum]|uniref:Anhydro-N-acetylmuramic acid kinase n=1 Tax=Tenacibaculum maritimum NCIMB 2154 TaxID=1349785 RepID=A0A2H1ED82_9FLAO|nr:anhydro-N-acetylmuramic acid kinase [Tenacibaculum maritimum]MCD9563123.1 anhydro-N-acetylmuramic acid kinase [Tenacibaculum maritimum]MCD9565446.1 anhydro-N-acetylmuramic acid kinase [Tenacibaculum maritimum]MCD9578096.1 anhydro-N-acetylmuramic acid kinase [Tenacibaculum maritimum]MCD9585308.1 anhydro-N-acetylmuramic acid kinase [Tenacibaculum maritimum]MCD9596038.1 anhydro-N-acetylmuramic acid kinase [Tenacibaculum maritimum]